LIEEII
jgi:hypothetical protein